MGTGEPFLSSSQPPISSSRWLWLKVSDLLNHVFPHRAETWEQKPTKLGNILTILNLGGENMGTGEPSLSSSQPLSIPSSRWLWVEISDLLCFYAFYALLLLVFWFSLVKTPLAFFFPIHCEFWAWFSTNKYFKRTQWEIWVVLTFFAFVAKHPWHFGNSTGESSSWNKRSNVSEDAKPTKRWCFSHQLVVLREIIWYFVTQEKHGEVELK